jgi:protein-disulfide isomerase
VSKLDAVLAAYPGKVKLVFKQFPLDTHSKAALAAAAAIAAHRQSKFWEMHDAMFEHRKDLSLDNIRALAGKIGLDMKRFDADLPSDAVRKAVVKDMEDGDKAGVEGTPTVYIDGKKYNGSLDLPAIKPIIDAELKTGH